jgi:hypothetical protein
MLLFHRKYISRHYQLHADINDVMGVLSCVGQEYYRRVAVPLEQKKIDINGDVYGGEI